MKYLLAMLICSVAVADVSLTVTPGKGVDLVRSSTKIGIYPDMPSCIGALQADAEARKLAKQNYSCRVNWDTITARYVLPATPVACQVSEWGPWVASMTGTMKAEVRTRTVITQPANGGAVCPSLTESRMVAMDDSHKWPIPPRGTEVYNTLRVRDTTETVVERPGEYGQFRVPCSYSHMAYDDPIVFAGSPGASHLHMFFGNTSVDANTTQQSLDTGASTCRGGTANRSSYWVPAVIDTGLNAVVVPNSNLVYYKGGFFGPAVSPINAPPNGLKMIAGNPVTWDKELTWDTTPNLNARRHSFECWSDKLPGGRSGKMQRIPAGCPAGGEILFELMFPTCWDGKNLDSPNHRSHMADPPDAGVPCPATHPVPITSITFNVHLPVLPGHDTGKWRLTSDAYDSSKPGGYSAHGDVWVDWDEDIKKAWLEGCIRSGADCHAHMLGDRRALY